MGTSRTRDSRSEVGRVAEIEEQAEEEETTPAAETEWDENEPSPHQGEEGQQESEA
jgi:hypothetical protein